MVWVGCFFGAAEHKCRMARAQGGRGTDFAGLFFGMTSIKRLILHRKSSENLFSAKQHWLWYAMRPACLRPGGHPGPEPRRFYPQCPPSTAGYRNYFSRRKGPVGGPYRISPWKIHATAKTPASAKSIIRATARGETMDQSIAGFASEAPRRFRRDWALTVLWPALGCGGVAAALVREDLRLRMAPSSSCWACQHYIGSSSGCCRAGCSARWSAGRWPGRQAPGAAARWR